MPHPKFLVYNAGLHADRMRCSFDVVRADDRELGNGTLEWIVKCFAALELDALAKAPWEITPFCSPAYGKAHGPHWIDRNPMAWRVTVGLSQAYRWPAFAFRAAAGPVYELDPTGPAPDYDREDYFIFNRRPGVVLAAFPETDITQAKARLEALSLPHKTGVEYWELTPELTECRIHVGDIEFPAGEARLAETVRACSDAGALCHWSDLAPFNEL